MPDNAQNSVRNFNLSNKDYDKLFDILDQVAIDIIQLHGLIVMTTVLAQFKDQKGRIHFDYIETYVRKKAYNAKKQKVKVDSKLGQIIKQCNLEEYIKKSGF